MPLIVILLIALMVILVGIILYAFANGPDRVSSHSGTRVPAGRKIDVSGIGPMVQDQFGFWTIKIDDDPDEFNLTIADSVEAPDESLVAEARTLLAELDRWEERAREYLKTNETEVQASFHPLYAIHIGNQDEGVGIVIEFLDEEADFVWGVRFINGEPRFIEGGD